MYEEFEGLFEQLEHNPAFVPLQLLRYVPALQFKSQFWHLNPLPEVWLHSPVRYVPEAQD